MDLVKQPVEVLTQAVQGERHSIPLQSMRGIAALIVLLFHCSIYFNQAPLTTSLFARLFNGPASVLSFFVLSGFVLTLSQLNRPLTIGETAVFYLRRIFRIYPALWFAVILALVYHMLALHEPPKGPVSNWWLSQLHPQGLNSRLLIETLAGKATEITLPIWTLNIELIGSLIMPLIVLGVLRAKWILGALLIFMFALGVVFQREIALLLIGFVFGASLTLFCSTARSWVRSRRISWLLALVGVLLLWYGRTLFGHIPDQPYGPIGVTVSSLGAALLVLILYVRPTDFPIMSGSVVAWLGDVSYSFYLLHMPILGLVGLAIGPSIGSMPLPFTTLLLTVSTIALTGLAATASYRLIEVPGILLAKSLIPKLRRRV